MRQSGQHLTRWFARVSRPQASSSLNRSGARHVADLACGSISHMTELTDVCGAFGYGDSILVGERVRLRGVRDDDVPALARWEMDPGRLITLSNWVAPPSEAAATERVAKRSANEEDDLGFAIETLNDPPVLVGRIWLSAAEAGPKDRCAAVGIALGREHIGRGYGTDAMRIIVGYGFREMGLHRIQLGVAAFNSAGIRAYQKAGFLLRMCLRPARGRRGCHGGRRQWKRSPPPTTSDCPVTNSVPSLAR
jgi:RimJ/RimL family protein N-acetyltransferase